MLQSGDSEFVDDASYARSGPGGRLDGHALSPIVDLAFQLHRPTAFHGDPDTMAQTEGDFEKGEADGTTATLAVAAATARAWLCSD
jgi:hypothetical protein